MTRPLAVGPWRLRGPVRSPFSLAVAVSVLLHVALVATLAHLPLDAAAPPAIYTVRMVEAQAGIAASLGPARPSAAQTVPTLPAVQNQPLAPTIVPATSAAGAHEEDGPPPEPEALFSDPAPATAAAPKVAAPGPALAVATSDAPPSPPSAAMFGVAGFPLAEANTLDAGFALLTSGAPEYPASARQAGKSGQVRLEVEVGPDGRVLAVRVLEATPGWGFADAARAAYLGARFAPPRVQGRPVRVLWRKTLQFRP